MEWPGQVRGHRLRAVVGRQDRHTKQRPEIIDAEMFGQEALVARTQQCVGESADRTISAATENARTNGHRGTEIEFIAFAGEQGNVVFQLRQAVDVLSRTPRRVLIAQKYR